MRHFVIVPLIVLSGFAAFVLACGSGSGKGNSSGGTATAAVAPAASPSADAGALATAAAGSRAARLGASLFMAGDLPADMRPLTGVAKILKSTDVPGLTGAASAYTVSIVSADQNEFVSEAIVVPDSGDAAALLSAFTADRYKNDLTAGASDATAAPAELPGSPAGAKALSYAGTLTSGSQSHHIDGDAIAFVRGQAFVFLVHGRYAPSSRVIDLGGVAARIDARLVSAPLP